MGISQSLYNGAYIDDYNYTRKLITNAYLNNNVQMETYSFSNPAAPTEAELKGLIAKLRELYLNFQAPSTEFNAWGKVGGYGKKIVSWSNPRDIVVFLSNKLASVIDVNVLASAFNIDKSDLLGRVYYVPDFDQKDEDGNVVVDGSSIYAFICDRRWFKIRDKAMFMDEFYNANNRSWQQYLNVIKSFNYSLFANAKMLVSAIPSINAATITGTDQEVAVDGEKIATIVTTPFNATETISFTSSDVGEDYVKITKVDDRHVKIEGVAATTGLSDVPAYVTITATGGTSGHTGTFKVVVKAA